ncbi:MAG: sulfur carrier protein ThiS [Pirellulaceae bacterium]|nr:sulfur carrier protein ThiS [Pirellulaceae bacterium]
MSNLTSYVCIHFNGQPVELAAESTVEQLLEQMEIRSQLVAVEINLNIIPRADHARHRLKPDDVVEVVTLVGGG